MAINRVNIMGNLTRDAELREVRADLSVANFTVAVNDRRRGSDGEWVDDPVFVRCALFGTRGEKLAPYLKKGTKVAVDGRLRYSSYMKDDEKRSELSVIVNQLEFCAPKPKDGEAAPAPAQSAVPEPPAQPDLYDDDIPF